MNFGSRDETELLFVVFFFLNFDSANNLGLASGSLLPGISLRRLLIVQLQFGLVGHRRQEGDQGAVCGSLFLMLALDPFRKVEHDLAENALAQTLWSQEKNIKLRRESEHNVQCCFLCCFPHPLWEIFTCPRTTFAKFWLNLN